MEISVKEVKQLFEEIGKSDIDENCCDFIEEGIIDSLAIMSLIGAIEQKYDLEIDFDYMVPENFKNFNVVKNMIEELLKNQ
ncbi:phosphopantetheine-binding protein [Campylobacter molothri]|uniref:phosphopantetheine-binding protein n=1 Tax=Campylobacter molothri TaxID=1032242 RepID=UPI003D9FD8CA